MKKLVIYLLSVSAFGALLVPDVGYTEQEKPLRKVLTLDDLTRDVLESNPEMKFYKAELKAARADWRRSGALQNPEGSLQLGRKEETAQGGLSGEGRAWSVSVSQTFEFPGRSALRKAIAANEVKLAEIGVEKFESALRARVVNLAYQLSSKQMIAAAAQRVANRGEELIAVLVQRDPAGVAPLLETRIIEASVIQLKRRANEAEKEAQSVLFSINLLRGAPVSEQFDISQVRLDLPKPPDAGELVQAAQKGNFELRSQIAELESQGFKVALAKNERWPSVSVAPFYSEEEADSTERTYGVGLSVPLPVWNSNVRQIDANKAREEQARATLEMAQRKVEQEIYEELLSYKLHSEEIGRWQPNVADRLREAAELGDRHYRLGSLPVATYVELQEQYLDALEAITQTNTEALENILALELLSGRKLLTEGAIVSRKKESQ